MDYKTFKQNRANLATGLTKIKPVKPNYVDDRFWELTMDETKVGKSIIRFLPQKDPEKSPIVLYFNHGFKENGKWFWENCPTTIEQPCPICEYVQPFWDIGTEDGKAKAFKYSRKKNYICNILVVNDVAKPENNGKIFLFKFGAGIFEKVMEKLAPDSELVSPVMVLDLWEGRNFYLKSKKKDNYPNYDASAFLDVNSSIAENEKDIEKLFEQIYELDEFIDPKKFNTYDSIEKRFNTLMKIRSVSSEKRLEVGSDINDMIEEEMPKNQTKKSDVSKKENSIEEDFNFEDDEDFNFEDDGEDKILI